jgi:hypothetical protein
LQPLVEKIDIAIREANLEDAFVAAQKRDADSADTKSHAGDNSPPSADVNGSSLPVTERDRFLLTGDLNDIEILYNATASAPHIAENLRGDFVFSQGVARVCLFGQNPDDLLLVVSKVIATKSGAQPVGVHVGPCDPANLPAYDLVAFVRGSFLKSPREEALNLIKQVETSAMKPFAEVSAAELAKSADAEHAAIEKVRVNVAEGAVDGFGVALLKNGSSALCVSVKAWAAAHRQLLLRSETKLDLDMHAQAVLRDLNIEDAFIAAQHDQCEAVYASAADLKVLTAALTRADMPFAFSSLWVLPGDVAREDAAISGKAKMALQQQTERAQRNADAARLATQRAVDLSATEEAQQAALRGKYGETAKGAANTLGAEVTAWAKDESGNAGRLFPQFESWLADKLADHWEVTTSDSVIEDYGASSFKNRILETVFARVTVHMKNRMLGEYNDACFVFGRINDSEFSMFREPIVARCDDIAEIRSWKMGHDFRSEWTVGHYN